MSHPDIISALQSPEYFQSAFPHLETWASWMVFLQATYGLPMDGAELALFEHFTGRTIPDPKGYSEAYCVVGRRGGKSRIAATIAAWEAICGGWEERLSKGEKAWIWVIANDKAQAGIVFSYLRSLLDQFPGIKQREGVEEIYLKSGICLGVKTCSFRGTRGFSTACVVCDEIAFWRDSETSANPASEVITSILPGLMPGAKLLGISTPYSKMGLLYETYREHWGKDTDILVWKGRTTEMNPTYDPAIIKRLVARDPTVFRAEYDGDFREDISSFLSELLVRAAMIHLPSIPDPRVRYFAFCDPSGGRQDSMTLGIAHREGNDKVVLDRVEERKAPFDPSQVVMEFCGLLKVFGCHSVTSDRFGGVWVEDSFRKAGGIRVEMSDLSASDIYLEAQPLFSMGRVALLDDERLALQLMSLERRTQPGGKDKVTHPEGYKDDLANAVCGALVMASRGTVWDEKEMEARLPVAGPHGRPQVAAEARRQSMEAEMADFMNGSQIIRK